MRRLALAVAWITIAMACRGSDGAAPDASAIEPDGVDGTGCTPRTARSVPLEAFVGPTGLQDRVDAAIDSAQTTLDVQMYLFTVKDIANHIVAARMRGVAVRVILDPDEAGNASVTGIFNSGGVQWLNASRVYSYAHAKYLIIDRTTTLVMSMNFNADAMDKERNYGFVDRDPEDVTDLQAIFDQDWLLAQGKSPPDANLDCTRMIVSPTNSNQRIYDFINSANTTLLDNPCHTPPGVSSDSVCSRYAVGVTLSAGALYNAVRAAAAPRSRPPSATSATPRPGMTLQSCDGHPASRGR
jgi:phosphatidylserine/phosphatidylglycerophosphate/cardiolipin synthase-like enzyme